MGRCGILYEIDGRFYTLKDIAQISGCAPVTIKDRLKRGWTGKRLLSPPTAKCKLAADGVDVPLYTKAELYDMWRSNFGGQLDEVTILADFMGGSKTAAEKLLKEFQEAENND